MKEASGKKSAEVCVGDSQGGHGGGACEPVGWSADIELQAGAALQILKNCGRAAVAVRTVGKVVIVDALQPPLYR